MSPKLDDTLETLTDELTADLTLAAIARWGADRAEALADTIRSTATSLAVVETTDLDLEDEPDYIR